MSVGTRTHARPAREPISVVERTHVRSICIAALDPPSVVVSGFPETQLHGPPSAGVVPGSTGQALRLAVARTDLISRARHPSLVARRASRPRTHVCRNRLLDWASDRVVTCR